MFCGVFVSLCVLVSACVCECVCSMDNRIISTGQIAALAECGRRMQCKHQCFKVLQRNEPILYVRGRTVSKPEPAEHSPTTINDGKDFKSFSNSNLRTINKNKATC